MFHLSFNSYYTWIEFKIALGLLPQIKAKLLLNPWLFPIISFKFSQSYCMLLHRNYFVVSQTEASKPQSNLLIWESQVKKSITEAQDVLVNGETDSKI